MITKTIEKWKKIFWPGPVCGCKFFIILWNPVGPVDTWIVEKRILESWQLAVKSLNPISIFCLDLPTVQGSACILKIFRVFSPSDALKSGESLNLRPEKRVAPKMWSKHIKTNMDSRGFLKLGYKITQVPFWYWNHHGFPVSQQAPASPGPWPPLAASPFPPARNHQGLLSLRIHLAPAESVTNETRWNPLKPRCPRNSTPQRLQLAEDIDALCERRSCWSLGILGEPFDHKWCQLFLSKFGRLFGPKWPISAGLPFRLHSHMWSHVLPLAETQSSGCETRSEAQVFPTGVVSPNSPKRDSPSVGYTPDAPEPLPRRPPKAQPPEANGLAAPPVLVSR